MGLKFRRQHPIEGFIVDFYCFELQLAIELDGGIHRLPEQEEQDDFRMLALQDEGITILRFWNSEVITNIENVLSTIEMAARKIQE